MLLFLLTRPAAADGLIFRLPPDGTAVELTGESVGEVRAVVPKELEERLTPESRARLTEEFKFEAAVTVSSVGKVARGGQACRWIELTMRSRGEKDAGEKTSHVLKVLIPEKFLRRGEDPLSHSVLTFFNPKEVDELQLEPEKGFNRIQYEIDRFRSVFPERLDKVRELSKKSVSTPVGNFKDCEVISGVTEFDRPLLGGGRWAFQHEWQIVLHPDAPFGVVAIDCQMKGSEFDEDGLTLHVKGTSTLTLSKIRKNATSVLSDEAGAEEAAEQE
jgi:hypothetical protein